MQHRASQSRPGSHSLVVVSDEPFEWYYAVQDLESANNDDGRLAVVARANTETSNMKSICLVAFAET
jgi:hypothetical protein